MVPAIFAFIAIAYGLGIALSLIVGADRRGLESARRARVSGDVHSGGGGDRDAADVR